MNYYKFINMVFEGDIDYKGMDINQFVPFSQYYNFTEGYCILQSNELIPTSPDVIEITDIEYENLKQVIISAQS